MRDPSGVKGQASRLSCSLHITRLRADPSAGSLGSTELAEVWRAEALPPAGRPACRSRATGRSLRPPARQSRLRRRARRARRASASRVTMRLKRVAFATILHGTEQTVGIAGGADDRAEVHQGLVEIIPFSSRIKVSDNAQSLDFFSLGSPAPMNTRCRTRITFVSRIGASSLKAKDRMAPAVYRPIPLNESNASGSLGSAPP